MRRSSIWAPAGARATLLGLGLSLLLALPGAAWAADGVVQVTLGGVKQVMSRGAILRLSVGDAEIAEISPLGSTEILIKGKRIGSTTLMVWGRDGDQASYTIQVQPDAEEVAATLRELFPEEPVTVAVSGMTLVLRGKVSGLDALESISRWAESYKASLGQGAGRLGLLNRMELPAKQQVQLEVRFAEVSRSAMRKLGVSLIGGYDGNIGGVFGPSSGVPALESQALPINLPTPASEAMGILFLSDPQRNFPFNALLSILSSRGLAKTLSEPTLVAMSGQKANFLVGGEFPVPIPLGYNQVSIEYKKFGVQLEFEPLVLSDDTLQLKVGSTVSDLDFAKPLRLQSTTVPSLTTRSSETTIRLRSGQSFTIAGLLSDKLRSTVDKVPLLGDIPVLGMLFRSKHFQREETELVVVVTARLVGPSDSKRLPPLPGEATDSDPNDFELFLMGWGEADRPNPEQAGARPAGRVGYRK